MAKGTVEMTCSQCGATYTATRICRNCSDADAWEGWMANQEGYCRECYAIKMKNERDEKRTVENAKNKAIAKTCPLDLPILTGSEKQVAWATAIRNKYIADCISYGANWDVIINKEYPAEEEKDVKKLYNPSAKFWIDSRGEKIFGVTVDIELWKRYLGFTG